METIAKIFTIVFVLAVVLVATKRLTVRFEKSFADRLRRLLRIKKAETYVGRHRLVKYA